MKALSELAPWVVHSLGSSPFPGFWCFNPSIVRTPDEDGGRWLCSIRCANYHLPGSVAQVARDDMGPIRNRILLLTLDPVTWRAVRAVEVKIAEGVGRPWNPALSFEDLRLIWTDGSLHATASAMRADTSSLEIVLVRIDEREGKFTITKADALRGPWSSQHQKNWSPFATNQAFRALYSPLGGGIHDRHGRIVATNTPPTIAPVQAPRGLGQAHAHRQYKNGSMEIQLRHTRPLPEADLARANQGALTRLALRGGTQLVQVGNDRWLGLAHGCRVGFAKFYWHQFYEVDTRGTLLSLSEPLKLSPAHGIEFAAGMAIDIDAETDALVISYGVEDDSAWLGVTELDAVMALLRPVTAEGDDAIDAVPMSQLDKNAIVLSE